MNSLKNIICIFLLLISISLAAQVNFSSNADIIVLENNGDTLKNPWVGGLNYPQFSEIDLNLDGIKDLFVFDKQDDRILPYINNGIPNQVSYTHAPEYVQDFPKFKDWVLLRDYNCDGKMDVFTLSSAGVAVYENTSTSTLSFTLVTNRIFSNYQPNMIGLLITSADIPAIDDIDGDGDLDILTFSTAGSHVEYHKNLSIENYGTCDSLTFELRNSCWGFFKENFSDNTVVLNDTCGLNVSNPEKGIGGNKHAGSTLLTLDVDSNGTKELVLGDISFSNLLLLYNNDVTIDLTGSNIISQDTLFPANNLSTTPVDMNLFPAGYYLDINNDNVKDLVVSSNCFFGCENDNNIWYYENNHVNNKPHFNLVKTGFLQEEMIEVGEGSYPVFFDYNADGLQDIVVGNYGDFDLSVGALGYKPSLSLYENIGTPTLPAYQLIDSDYVSLSTLNLDLAGNQPTLRLTPTFGDLDNDNDLDMIIGDHYGYLHYFTNTAGTGNTASFVLSAPQYFGIDIGNYASPQLIDLDRDNLLDLVIGNRNGYVSYYRNTGTASLPNFTFITDSLGYMKTMGYNENNGISTPFVFDDGGNYKIIAGSTKGYLYYYDNIDGNLSGTFNIIDSTFLNILEGSRSYVSLADVTNDGDIDMLIGSYAGGVTFYEGVDPAAVKSNIADLDLIKIYPNPTKNSLTIDFGLNDLSDAYVTITDMIGKTIFEDEPRKRKMNINLNNYSRGVYLVQFSNKISKVVYKIIKQ